MFIRYSLSSVVVRSVFYISSYSSAAIAQNNSHMSISSEVSIRKLSLLVSVLFLRINRQAQHLVRQLKWFRLRWIFHYRLLRKKKQV